MKTIYLLLLLGAVVSVSSQGTESVFLAIQRYLKNAGAQYREECIKTSDVDPKLVDELEQKAEAADDKKLKCYLECQYLKTNVIDETGIVNVEGLKEILKATNENFILEIEKQCKHPKSTDICEAAFESTKCVMKILREEHDLH